MAMTKTTVLVLGGYGYVGRYVVRSLRKMGAKALIGTRGKRNSLCSTDRRIVLHEIRSVEDWDELLQDVDAVVNSVGILRERCGESYEAVHYKAVDLLARACAEKDIRLVHVSALGLENPVTSEFSLSKKKGENAIRRTNGDWHIVRASLVDASDGYGASWFRRIAAWPIHIIPTNANGGFSPISATDLGEILATLTLGRAHDVHSSDRIYEVGCGETYKPFEYLETLAGKAPLFRIRLPVWFSRLGTLVCDWLNLTPLTFGHYELLMYKNAPENNRAHELLGRLPEEIGAVVRDEEFVQESLITCRQEKPA